MTYSIEGPKTIFDWAALRENYRGKIELLGLKTLSVLYGLSNTFGFQDDNFVLAVEDHLSKFVDPVRTRFDFAYQLVSGFWDSYELWYSDIKKLNGIENAGHFVPEFHDKVLKWLVDGLTLYSSEMEVMDSAYFTVSRIGNHDTFLEEADIPVLEAAAGKEISLETSEGGRQLVEHLVNFYRMMNNGNQGKTDPSDNSPPKNSEKIQ
ncbi:MAG: hypothetical protein DCC56_15450 [Anaerolineae bacterium]|nr:MAG: hypothetical protein DCC56_15450 [Anaerolineae bacterium]WKZ45608.1 MAG: hypothetical protein QY302_07430 [Anaerolineales bacterium]